MTALFATVFVASLTGSLHCAGMCGPLVTMTVGAPGDGARRFVPLSVAYHGGRLISYAALGLLAGLLGAGLDFGGAIFGFQRTALVLAGAAMILAGLIGLLRWAGAPLPIARAPRRLSRLLFRLSARMSSYPPVWRSLGVGLATTLLPCGWLYAFVITAAGTGSALLGVWVMIAFWVGTLPVLTMVGVAVHRLAGPLRRWVPALTALALVAVGLFVITSRFDVPPLSAEPTAASPACHGHP